MGKIFEEWFLRKMFLLIKGEGRKKECERERQMEKGEREVQAERKKEGGERETEMGEKEKEGGSEREKEEGRHKERKREVSSSLLAFDSVM